MAHNTAYAVAERMSAETVIVDFDLPFGTAGLDFNQDPLTGVADALSQPERLDPVLLDRLMVRCTDRLSLFAAPATLEQDWDIGPEAFEEVAQRIRTTAPYVVLDLPHQWNAWVRRMMIQADEVVVVATPDLASLRNAKNMIDLVKAARPNDAPPRLVVNQVGVPGRPEIPLKEFSQALGCAPALVLPFEPKLYRPSRQQRSDDPGDGGQVEGGRRLPAPGPDRGQARGARARRAQARQDLAPRQDPGTLEMTKAAKTVSARPSPPAPAASAPDAGRPQLQALATPGVSRLGRTGKRARSSLERVLARALGAARTGSFALGALGFELASARG